MFVSYPAYAGVVKLADTPDLGSGAARCAGSSPVTRILYDDNLLNSRDNSSDKKDSLKKKKERFAERSFFRVNF